GHVAQFDEGKAGQSRGRMIHDLTEDDGSDEWTAVGQTGCRCDLSGELLFPGADDVASERLAIGRGAKAKPVTVTGEIAVRVAGKQIHVIAPGIEGKAVIGARSRVEVAFLENKKAERANRGRVRQAELGGDARGIGEEPAAQADGIGRGI